MTQNCTLTNYDPYNCRRLGVVTYSFVSTAPFSNFVLLFCPQLWHHRQWAVMQLVSAYPADSTNENKEVHTKYGLGELEFTADVISDDSKNYHAWQHRRWAVNYFKIPSTHELQYTETLILEDVYNNSAWNHRFVTVSKDEGLTPPVLQRVSGQFVIVDSSRNFQNS
ncbi:unnamed protein product [Dicrocoelium dendriticum]|nr:unnamed protein product [Dicrocoelium dendriticum]